MRQQASFQVPELDCAEEVLLLRSGLEKQPGILALEFDILRGRMFVEYDDALTSPPAIAQQVANLGLHALASDAAVGHSSAHVHQGGCGGCHADHSRHSDRARHSERSEESLSTATVHFARNNSRLVLTIASGVLLALAALVGRFTAPTLSSGLYLASIVAGAWFVLPKAWLAVRRLRADMNMLMMVAVVGAIWLGEWLEAASVTFLFSLALLLEQWSLGRARRAIAALLEVTPAVARVLSAGGDASEGHEMPVASVPIGGRILVRPGEKIPLDGRIVRGHSDVNEAPITGESLPRAKQPSDEVFAGSINGGGTLTIETTRAASDTTLARIVHMVEQAQSRRAPSQQFVETFAQYYTPAMMVLAGLIAIIPPLLGGAWTPWFYQALVVLVIACPCALVISTPVSIVSALTAAMRRGVLIKGGRFLEAAARIRAIAVDKTGTLTLGRPRVESIVPFAEHTASEVLSRAAAMEAHSTHPIAAAVSRRAVDAGVTITPADEYRVLPGKGAEGVFAGRPFWIGSHRFLHEKMTAEPEEVHAAAVRLEDAGHTVVAVGNAAHVCGLISLADEPRPDVRCVVTELRRAGVEHVAMLTGDHAQTAAAVAEVAGIDAWHADLLPQDKVALVESLRQRYEHVAMIGDGVNDAPAMAAASVGIAMGAIGSDTAIETADIALVSDDLARVPWLMRHAARTLRIVRQNIGFALATKGLFLVLAAVGLGSLWMAVAADMGTSLLVVFNALRLLRAQETNSEHRGA